ncbi:hypothetical protein SUGI_0068600 [Cryptomeria japonica]|nr:hypothetical protein SUGI_0068600 [Cryptomeria japonica]
MAAIPGHSNWGFNGGDSRALQLGFPWARSESPWQPSGSSCLPNSRSWCATTIMVCLGIGLMVLSSVVRIFILGFFSDGDLDLDISTLLVVPYKS